jgi:glucose 1-dehydrogenase
MQISLDRQVALVTGASSGIGAGAAKALAAAGAAVVFNYNTQATPAEELARQINAEGGRAIAIGADVSKEADVERLFAQALEAFGFLDILVANSGLQKDGFLKLIPYGQVGEVDDIVSTTLFIDGGMSLYPEFRGNG